MKGSGLITIIAGFPSLSFARTRNELAPTKKPALTCRRRHAAQVVLADPVIHLYWAYALARAEEMLKVTHVPPGVCGAQAEREYVTLDPKRVTCQSCREMAKRRSVRATRLRPRASCAAVLESNFPRTMPIARCLAR
jgi:hypothetical protein